MSRDNVLIVNEAHDHVVIVSGEVIEPRQELSRSIGEGLTIESDGALCVSVISQAESDLLVTQGETGVQLQPGQRYVSQDEVEPIHIVGVTDEAV